MERRQLKAVMKTEVLDQHFTSAVFAFTDDTAAELKRQGIGTATASSASENQAEEMRTLFRHDLKFNLENRLLEDVIHPGEFKKEESERNKNLQVISYANRELANRYGGLSGAPGMALGTMSTTGMLKRATSEGDAAVQIYTEFFGPLAYDHLYLTQQTACNYGQSWPMLVYLPICYFWDSTIQHQLGILDRDPTYWQVVTPHEVAHQWCHWDTTGRCRSPRVKKTTGLYCHISERNGRCEAAMASIDFRRVVPDYEPLSPRVAIAE
jgi:hypothetical protein